METKDVIFGRRSIRKYTNQPISDEDLQEIIEAGLYAPSNVNYQPWYFLVIKSDEKKKEMLEFMSTISKLFHPSLVNRFQKNPEAVEETETFFQGLGGAQVYILAFLLKNDYPDLSSVTQSVSAAIENMLLMAKDKGIGSCWLSVAVRVGKDEEIRQHFAPDKGPFLAMVTLGYPAEEKTAPPRREGRYDII
ncbi:MAG TPA: nitroreductase family protein [Firmicutes bacterium]|nr:nitroreductase family protein [Bacillota bacterium]